MEKPKREQIKKTLWRCRICGYICEGAKPPERCPICSAGRGAFERWR